MPGRLQGKNCIITGAAGGIGLETTICFAQEGANVLMSDINTAALSSALQKVQSLVPNAGKLETFVLPPLSSSSLSHPH